MAGLKTPPKKKNIQGKPSTVLIIFLVFFILLSIGLGVWGYYGYDGQDKLKEQAKNANAKASAFSLYGDYTLFLARDLRMATGIQPLEGDELNQYGDGLKEFINDSGKWKDEKTREGFKKLLTDLKTELGHDGTRYVSTFKDKVRQLNKELAETRAMVNKSVSDKDLADALFAKYQPEREKKYAELKADIKKGNDAALAANSARTKEMEDQFKRNEELDGQLRAMNAKLQEEDEKHKRDLKKLNDQIAAITNQKGNENEPQPKAGPGLIHALLLDISKGYPLWDNPLGKITRVDLENRQVYIDLGSAQRVQPELTFNVFGASGKGRAEKTLKGSIEVVRVLDANTSIARITSLYDAAGIEILSSDATRGRTQRESENAFKEGDLLFNMFWGSRVAIAGNISFGNPPSNSPAEQARSLDNLMRFLNRQGIFVDAYLDPMVGEIKGAITHRTRYLIRGDDLVAAKGDGDEPAPMPKKEAPKDEKAEEKKDEEKKDDGKKEEGKKEEMKKDEQPAGEPVGNPAGNRPGNLNELAAKMRAEAVDKGLFIISADNFLNVIGYRQARSANFAEGHGYRPSVITADLIPDRGVGNNGKGNGNGKKENPPEPKGEEKMEKEKMEKENVQKDKM